MLFCSAGFSLGMGELDLKSNLNQRFDGEITLNNLNGLQIDEVIPNLGSQKDFDRVGVDRDYHLTDLRFKVVQRETGDMVIHVTSSKPIIEPFLNFIVEVIWPTGRILREYTMLLDPPLFGMDGVEEIDTSTSMGTSTSAPKKSSQRRKILAAPMVSSGRSEGVVTQEYEYGLTGPGDTLWTISLKVRPNDRVSVQQTMLALQRANPEAFINNNINLLKAGHVLRIPDMDEIESDSTREAIAEVRVQNEEFQDYRSSDSDTSVTQLDARKSSRRDSGDAGTGDDGELKLLASDQTGARSGADDARAAELEDSLAVSREDLDRARRANNELNERMDDLASQVETLSEIVKLKDDQLAALRAELQRSQSSTPAAEPAATASVVSQPAESRSLLSNPFVLGGLGILLIGGIAGGLILMRRRNQDEDFPEVLLDEPEAKVKLSLPDDDAGDSESEDEEDEEDVTQQTSDVIGEAEIYIAYGRFPQAISFLQNAIHNEPKRVDVQLKLLEVYVQTEDATALNLQFEQLKLLGDDTATAQGAELQGQIAGAAETSAASMDATVLSSEPIDAIAEPAADDDLSFDLDDLDAEIEDDDDLDLGDALDAADEGDELTLDEAMELGDADLDLDLDALSDEPAATDDADLDLDLGDDLDLDLDDDDGIADTQQLGGGELDLSEELDLSDDLDLSDELDLDSDDGDDDALDLGDLGLDDDDDGAITLDLDDDDDDALDLSDLADDNELDLGDDDDALDLGSLDDDVLDLGDLEDDDDLGELNLDEDASSKLELARAYIEMGDKEGAKSLLDEVVSEGTDAEVSEANELLGSLG